MMKLLSLGLVACGGNEIPSTKSKAGNPIETTKKNKNIRRKS